MPKYAKEKITLLCELFIKTIKENPAPEQELLTRLYNLVNAVECRKAYDQSSYDAMDHAASEARETLKKLIQ